MSQIKSKGTSPELKIKKFLWGSGFSYQPKNIYGNPDFIHKKEKIAVFIDGCFWHGCPFCYKEPKSNKEYWIPKIKLNKQRDKRNRTFLRKKGWNILIIWEHEIPRHKHSLAIKEIIRKTL